jgi:hypothetical protein
MLSNKMTNLNIFDVALQALLALEHQDRVSPYPVGRREIGMLREVLASSVELDASGFDDVLRDAERYRHIKRRHSIGVTLESDGLSHCYQYELTSTAAGIDSAIDLDMLK